MMDVAVHKYWSILFINEKKRTKEREKVRTVNKKEVVENAPENTLKSLHVGQPETAAIICAWLLSENSSQGRELRI